MERGTVVFLYDILNDYIEKHGYKSFNKQNMSRSGEYEAKKIYLNEEYNIKDRVMLSNTAIDLVYKYFLKEDEYSKESLELFINNYNIVDYYYEFIEKFKCMLSEGIISKDILYDYGVRFSKESNNSNEIKLGLTLLRLSGKEEAKEIFKVFSIHNSYIFFCVEGVKEYSKYNTFIFEVCKISRGYGKLIAISKLEVLSDDIRFWLVEKGSDNNIIEEELANIIFEKLSIFWYLYNGKVNAKKFNLLSKIIGRLYRGNIYFKENYNYDLAYDYVNMFKKYGNKFIHLYALMGILVSVGEYNKNSLLKGRNSYKEAIKETKIILNDIEVIFSDSKWINIIKDELLKEKIKVDEILEVAFLLKQKLTFDDLYSILEKDNFNSMIYRYILFNSNKNSRRKIISFIDEVLKNTNVFDAKDITYSKEDKSDEDQCLYIVIKEMRDLANEFINLNIKALGARYNPTKKEALKNLKENKDILSKENFEIIKCIADSEEDLQFARELMRFINYSLESKISKKIDIKDIEVQNHSKDNYLITLKVAGTEYLDIRKATKSLLLGDIVFLREEKKNPFDENAIMVISNNGYHIGYIPRKDNLILKNLLVEGKKLYGLIKEIDENYKEIVISVYISYRDIEEDINSILKMMLSSGVGIIN